MKQYLFIYFCFAVSQSQGLKSLDPISTIVKQLNEKSIVAFGESHDIEEIYNFYFSLLENKNFVQIVDDIVLEFANSLYQDLLDDFISGKDISIEQLSIIWRNHSNALIQSGDSPLFIELLKRIRSANQNRSGKKQIRALAADPAIDWQTIKSAKEFWPWIGRRDRSFLRVIWDDVIDKNRKAFVILGRGHLSRNDPYPANYFSLAELLEKRLKHPIYIIHIYTEMKQLELTNPSLIEIKNSWIGRLRRESKAKEILYEEQIDAVLYLGPKPQLHTISQIPFSDADYLAELDRRSQIVHKQPFQLIFSEVLRYKIEQNGLSEAIKFYDEVKNNQQINRYNFQSIFMIDLINELKEKQQNEAAKAVYKIATEQNPNDQLLTNYKFE
ncbi:MAG: hypothetical protein KDD94_01625 [Calditrichaeota bacterium]|nr:hypothetical protein [Calditrichota bacterium]